MSLDICIYDTNMTNILNISITSKNFLVLFSFFSKNTEHETYSQHILKCIIPFKKYRHYVVQVSKVYSSYITETLHSLEKQFPHFPLSQPLAITILLSVSLNLIIFDSSYERILFLIVI